MASPIAAAQEAPAPAPATAHADVQPGAKEDEVVVIGRYHRDRAMDAFLRGDFATAEIEFQNNLHCIQRLERQKEDAIQQASSDAITASMNASVGIPGGVGTVNIFNYPQRADEIADRTCHSPQWQLYMIGLSQIQLGRFAEAKRSLYRVTRLSREDAMFDAHYRIGLLELLDRNIDAADRRLAHLSSMQRSCRKRGARCEFHADLDMATAYLRHAIEDARLKQSVHR